MKLIKLDRRMTGYTDFQYMVKFSTGLVGFDNFYEARNWCWETWGPSCELVHYKSIQNNNPAWCWNVIEFEARLYFTSSKEANWFILKWS